MSSKATSLMKSAQIEKTKQTIQQLVEWYASKEEFFKKYLPIQQVIIKRLLAAPEMTLVRVKEIAQIVAEEKEVQAAIFERNEKNVLNQEARFAPKVQERVDPKDPKGATKMKVELPTWSNNIDRILVSMSKGQKQRQSRIKSIYKLLDSIQEQLTKEEGRYRGELKNGEKELDRLFNKLDQYEKEESRTMGRILKESKGDNIKDSSFFIGQLKKLQTDLNGEFQSFVERNKVIVKLVQLIIKNEKAVSKKIKEQLTAFLTYKKENNGKESRVQEEIWGFLSLTEDKIEEERIRYFNATLLKKERLQDIKAIVKVAQFKSNWQAIVNFLQLTKVEVMKCTKSDEQITKLLKNMSYRCWGGISLAQGWLIESYTSAILYMTYDYIMIIYSMEGVLLKKIHTSSSKVNKTEGQTLFLEEKIKGFFSDSIEEYKLRFEDPQRMEEFQLFIENQVK